jgi:isoleucyl-tRNA synthetase
VSALYCDVRKDRLYCDATSSTERRATQTVLYEALEAMTTAMAPILCFTGEEVWKYMKRPAGTPESVHLARLPAGWAADGKNSTDMAALLELRQKVQAALEPFRAQKKASLEAHVHIPSAHVPQGAPSPEWLADLFIVSKVTVEAAGTDITVEQAAGQKCERCWKWQANPLCARCNEAVQQSGKGAA